MSEEGFQKYATGSLTTRACQSSLEDTTCLDAWVVKWRCDGDGSGDGAVNGRESEDDDSADCPSACISLHDLGSTFLTVI